MKNDRYVFEETKASEWVQPIQVNEQKVEIRNYGIDMPRGYVIGFVVNGNELEKISTGSPEYMKLVRRTNFLQRLSGKIPSITNKEFLQHLNVWGSKMIRKYIV